MNDIQTKPAGQTSETPVGAAAVLWLPQPHGCTGRHSFCLYSGNYCNIIYHLLCYYFPC